MATGCPPRIIVVRRNVQLLEWKQEAMAANEKLSDPQTEGGSTCIYEQVKDWDRVRHHCRHNEVVSFCLARIRNSRWLYIHEMGRSEICVEASKLALKDRSMSALKKTNCSRYTNL